MSDLPDLAFQHSAEIDKLAAALAKAQGSIIDAAHDRTNPHFGRTYASLAACWSACRTPLATNGLAVVQGLATAGRVVVCTSLLTHSSGQWVRVVLELPAKADAAQAIGSAGSYARRYALCALVGIASADTDDDDDAEGATDRDRPRAQVQPTPGGANPDHHPSFTERDRRAFMAAVGEKGWKYEELKRFMAHLKRPKPSLMTLEQRRKLVTWLGSRECMPLAAEFLRSEDEPSESPGDPVDDAMQDGAL